MLGWIILLIAFAVIVFPFNKIKRIAITKCRIGIKKTIDKLRTPVYIECYSPIYTIVSVLLLFGLVFILLPLVSYLCDYIRVEKFLFGIKAGLCFISIAIVIFFVHVYRLCDKRYRIKHGKEIKKS